jgi:tetratricopeptide (TPR) repeat protein
MIEAQNPFAVVRAKIMNEEFRSADLVIDSCISNDFHKDSALFYQALIHLGTGKIKAAKRSSTSLKNDYPDFSEVHYLNALIFFTEENYGKSIDEFNLILKKKPDHIKALYNRSIAFGLLDEYLYAIEDLGTIISLKPNYASAYYSRAYWYEYTGNYGEALKDYEQSIKLDPKNFDAYFGMAFIYQNNKEPLKACETIDRGRFTNSTRNQGKLLQVI